MKKRTLAAALALTLAASSLAGCGGGAGTADTTTAAGQAETGNAEASKATEPAAEKKDPDSMPEYKTVYATELESINYLKSNSTDGMTLAGNTIDGLVEFDRFGQLQPCIAKEWTISEDQLVYTLKLRDDVKWYTWKGEEVRNVVAQDFVDSAEWILTKDNASGNSKNLYDVIKNAKEFYEGEITDFSEVGVKAIDEYTLEYTVNQPTPWFLNQLGTSSYYPVDGEFLEEQGDMFGVDKDTILYCGAYLMTSFEPQSQRTLEMNPNYWNADAIHIGRLNYKYNAEANSIGAELFLRGEINDFILPGGILDEWMNDPEKKEQMRPHNLTNMSYFIAFNFEPGYDESYAPEDWKTAINNLNFRKSLFHGFDRVAAISTVEPYNPESKLLNTLSRRNLVQADGVDYTMMPGLKEFTETESFNKEEALAYKEKAVEELTGKVSFPIKVVLPFSTAKTDTANRMQVIEQQMEGLLGKDYIDIILESYPSTGFTADVRNPGKFSIMELGWGPDYADPYGSMSPVDSRANGGKYGRVHMCEDLLDADGTSKFEKMLDEAHAETKDIRKRYEMFAEAEGYLLEQAVLIPFYTSGGGYRASYLDPFTGNTGQMGRNALTKLKGAVLLDKPMGMSEYPEAEAKFEQEREEALKK